jgi:hypothetical protein
MLCSHVCPPLELSVGAKQDRNHGGQHGNKRRPDKHRRGPVAHATPQVFRVVTGFRCGFFLETHTTRSSSGYLLLVIGFSGRVHLGELRPLKSLAKSTTSGSGDVDRLRFFELDCTRKPPLLKEQPS